MSSNRYTALTSSDESEDDNIFFKNKKLTKKNEKLGLNNLESLSKGVKKEHQNLNNPQNNNPIQKETNFEINRPVTKQKLPIISQTQPELPSYRNERDSLAQEFQKPIKRIMVNKKDAELSSASSQEPAENGSRLGETQALEVYKKCVENKKFRKFTAQIQYRFLKKLSESMGIDIREILESEDFKRGGRFSRNDLVNLAIRIKTYK